MLIQLNLSHGIINVGDLPIPFNMVLNAAVLTVVVTFVFLKVSWALPGVVVVALHLTCCCFCLPVFHSPPLPKRKLKVKVKVKRESGYKTNLTCKSKK